MTFSLWYDPEKTENEIHHLDLFPGFDALCSCEECLPKIRELKEFEKGIKPKRELVNDFLGLQNWSIDRCLLLSTTVENTKEMLDLLHNNLKIVSEKLGESFTLKRSNSVAKLEDTDLKIARFLAQQILIKDSEDPNASEGWVVHEPEEKIDGILPLGIEIMCALHSYGETKAKNAAHCLLKKIEDIEKEHESAKKSAEAHSKPMDPSISKKYIEEQIKLVKMLPVEELYVEVQELVPYITPMDHTNRAAIAMNDIMSTARSIIRIRNLFFLQYQSPSLTSMGNKHCLSGLKETLDKLLKKVKLLEDRWKTDYCHLFTYDRFACKRR